MPRMLESLAKLDNILEHAEHLIKKKILIPCSNAGDVALKFYITYIMTSLIFKPIEIFAVKIKCYLDLISTNYMC